MQRRISLNFVLVLVSQFLTLTVAAVLATIAGVAGRAMAADKALATLPVSMVILGTTVAAIPAARLMARLGRARAFLLGAAVGVGGAALAAAGAYASSFWGFTAGTAVLGVAAAFAQHYRFAASEVVRTDFRSQAISLVTASGLFAGFAGPSLAGWSAGSLDAAQFAGPCVAVGALYVLTAALSATMRIPPMAAAAGAGGSRRPARDFFGGGTLWVALVTGAVGSCVMGLLMGAMPLEMTACSFTLGSVATVFQWHLAAMYAPSFFTAAIIRSLGVGRLLGLGLLLNAVALIVGASGLGFGQFWTLMVLDGIGWNFLYIGSTALLAQSFPGADGVRVQGWYNLAVSGAFALASLSSGSTLALFGWRSVQASAGGLVVIGVAAVLWFAAVMRPKPAGSGSA